MIEHAKIEDFKPDYKKNISFYFSRYAYEKKKVVELIAGHLRQAMPKGNLLLYIHESERRDILVAMAYTDTKTWPKVVHHLCKLRREMPLPLYTTNKEDSLWIGENMALETASTWPRMSTIINLVKL